MKKFMLILCAILVFVVAKPASCMVFFHDEVVQNYWVDTSTDDPSYWVKLAFPYPKHYSMGFASIYEVTLSGALDFSDSPIDIFLSFDDTQTTYIRVASWDVDNLLPFTLTFDLLNDKLLYNGTVVDNDLDNISPSSFIAYGLRGLPWFDLYTMGDAYFYVGYGCHFLHEKTELDYAGEPVPEPATMLLLSSGLLGLVGLKRKCKKQ